jgi:general secretion pathway protein H
LAGPVNINARPSAGFTLIELLVVMLIVALMASVVVLNMPPPASQARTEADMFAARLNAAAELAITTGSMIGLELDADGYKFYRYDRGVWNESAERRLAFGAFPPDMGVDFTLVEPAKKNEVTDDKPRDKDLPAPSIFFSPTGETTPLSVDFSTRGAVRSVNLDASGNVRTGRNDQG